MECGDCRVLCQVGRRISQAVEGIGEDGWASECLAAFEVGDCVGGHVFFSFSFDFSFRPLLYDVAFTMGLRERQGSKLRCYTCGW